MGDSWSYIWKSVGIERCLSTAFLPETDGSTERINVKVLTYLRAFISYTRVIGLNSYFLTHGYHAESIKKVVISQRENKSSPAKRARELLKRVVDAQEYAQAAMASAQQRMESSVNKKGHAQELYKLRDSIWLNLKIFRTL